MNIRLATIGDIDELVRMSKRFYEVSGYASLGKYCEDGTRLYLKAVISSNKCLVGNGGAIAFDVIALPMFEDVVLAQELFWWVDEDKRGSSLAHRLLSAAEEHAKHEFGATAMNMLNLAELNSDKMGKLYTRRGYVKKEQYWMREL